MSGCWRPGRLDCRIVAGAASLVTVSSLLVLTSSDPALTARLVAEDHLVEWLQVALTTTAVALAALQGYWRLAAGRPVAFEVAVVMSMSMVSIGETDLDRALFGTKLIATRFFVDTTYSIAVRALAITVVVGVPLAVGLWLLARWRDLDEVGRDALREPWGQVAAVGATLYLAVAAFERPLERIAWLPPYFTEETLELLAALCIVIGLGARDRS